MSRNERDADPQSRLFKDVIPSPGQTCRVLVDGRLYLGQVETVQTKVHVIFLTQVPRIQGKRLRQRAFLLRQFEPYGKSKIDWTLKLTDRERGLV